MIKKIILSLIGFSSGIIISGAVFAFISTLGIIQRLACKTKTKHCIKIYEETIIFGGMFGSLANLINLYLPVGKFIVCLLSFCTGIFYACLAMSLAEILDVIPTLLKRCDIKSGLIFFIYAIALGKFLGSVLYYCVSGFY